MAKWADYLISAVRYDSDKTHIEKVKVHEDDGDKVLKGEIWSRSSVLEIIDKKSFMTIYKRNDEWHKGAKVNKILVDKKYYLKTEPNNTKKDNLGELPEF